MYKFSTGFILNSFFFLFLNFFILYFSVYIYIYIYIYIRKMFYFNIDSFLLGYILTRLFAIIIQEIFYFEIFCIFNN